MCGRISAPAKLLMYLVKVIQIDMGIAIDMDQSSRRAPDAHLCHHLRKKA